MGKTLIRIVAVALLVCGCDAPSVEDVDNQDAAVTASEVAGALSIEAPPGKYNGFILDASCSTDDSAWTRSNYTIDPNLDCLDCTLPGLILIGQVVKDHEVSACLPSDAHPGCDATSDVSGLAMADFLIPVTLENGDHVSVDRIDVTFHRVYEAWDEAIADSYGKSRPFPRVDSASATLTISSEGVVSAASDWSFCEDTLNAPTLCY